MYEKLPLKVRCKLSCLIHIFMIKCEIKPITKAEVLVIVKIILKQTKQDKIAFSKKKRHLVR